MKIGDRGEVTIPKEIRDRFGLTANSEVDFHIQNGEIVLKKSPKRLDLEKWKGHCGCTFRVIANPSVDDFIEDVRGR
jgi:AbrB family looped-hinge helix DNA binding protein